MVLSLGPKDVFVGFFSVFLSRVERYFFMVFKIEVLGVVL